MTRGRLAGLLALLVALATPCTAEIVKVTAPSTTIYDSETKESRTVKIKGKRFLVYAVSKDWYLVGMTINGTKTLRWLPRAHAEVDWGETKTARVAEVTDENSLKLANGDLVQFCGIEVGQDGSALSGRTHAWLKKLIEGQEVILEYDAQFRQQHGCDSAYVYVGEQFVNRTLVAYGLATVSLRYVTGEGRYADVFRYSLGHAKEKGLGIWRKPEPVIGEADDVSEPVDDDVSEPAAADVSKPDEVPSEPASTETEQVHQLTEAQKAQWASNLQTQVKVASTCKKTKRDLVSRSQADGAKIPTETTRVWTKTLAITVRNGWAFPLKGFTVKYEWFAKGVNGSSSVVFHSSGEIAGVDLRPGETRELHSEPAEFEVKEKHGWARGGNKESGQKYYGYRVTLVYRGTPVKVVASSTTLVDFETSPED